MKRLFITLSIVMLAVAGAAQSYNLFEHTGNYPTEQCYGAIELGDGNLLVRVAAFDGNLDDIGYNLYKVTPQGELVDSLFVEDHHIYALFPMLRDPYADNSNIITSFYCEGSTNYFKALYFNDELELTKETVTQIPASFCMDRIDSFKSLVDCNNDIIVRMKTDDTNCKFLRIGLDGQLKCESQALYVGSRSCPENSLFVLTKSPLQYGFVTYSSSYIYITTLDSELNAVAEKKLKNFNGYNFSCVLPYINVQRLDDSHFLMTTMVYESGGATLTYKICVAVFSNDLELEAVRVFGGSGDEPLNRNLAVTDDCIYVAWMNVKPNGSSVKSSIIMTCLNKDLGIEWDSSVFSVEGSHILFGNYGMMALPGNGVAISGWLTKETAPYQSNYIYAVIFENTTLETPENQSVGNGIICYPNPVSGNVNVKVPSGAEIGSVSLHDVSGRLVKAQQSGFGSIDISGLAPGMYVMRVTLDDGKVFEEKIVKK